MAEEGVESLAEVRPGGRPGAVHGAHEEQDVGGDVARGGVADGGETRPDPAAVVEEVSDRDAERVALLTPLAAADLTGRIASRHASPLPPDRDENDRRGSPRRRPGTGRARGHRRASRPWRGRSKVPLRRARRKPRERGVLAGARGRTTRAHLRKRLAEVTGEVERAFYRLGAAAARADLRSPLTAIGHAEFGGRRDENDEVGDASIEKTPRPRPIGESEQQHPGARTRAGTRTGASESP